MTADRVAHPEPPGGRAAGGPAASGDRAATDGRAGAVARYSAVAFGALGVGLVLAGVASVAAGTPGQAYNLAPLTWPGDVAGRLGELTPLLAATMAALVALSVVLQVATRRLGSLTAAGELIVLGTAVEVCVAGSVGRIGYAADGSVLFAGVACLMGGVALISAGIVATLVSQ